MIGKKSLYDELLPHISELSSEDALTIGLLLANHRPKRHRDSSPSDLASPKHKNQRIEDTESAIARDMAVLTINPAAQMINTHERMEYDS